MNKDFLDEITGFDWDEANIFKSEIKHQVTYLECEQVFFNEPLFILDDHKHSLKEKRFAAFGFTEAHRYLTIIFTMRAQCIRVISARPMKRKERNFYEQNKEEITQI